MTSTIDPNRPHAYVRDRSRDKRALGDHDCAICDLPRSASVHIEPSGRSVEGQPGPEDATGR